VGLVVGERQSLVTVVLHRVVGRMCAGYAATGRAPGFAQAVSGWMSG
jgi:hypothetical protein